MSIENESLTIEGRNPILEAFRSHTHVDRLFVQKGLVQGPVSTILSEAKKAGTPVDFVDKKRLDSMSETGRHQGVMAHLSAYAYSTLEDVFALAKSKDEDPFIFLLDGIEDPHNFGAIIRSAHMMGAHGIIIPKRRASGLNMTAFKASAGAIYHIPIVKVTNITATMEKLKSDGMWFVCGDMDGEIMYDLNLTGSIGVVVGNEGEGVSRLVKEHCDMTACIPTKGNIDSLNASVAAAVLGYEVFRQRYSK